MPSKSKHYAHIRIEKINSNFVCRKRKVLFGIGVAGRYCAKMRDDNVRKIFYFKCHEFK